MSGVTYPSRISFNTRAEFPLVGSASYLYVAIDENVIYRWGGTQYIPTPDTSSFLTPADLNSTLTLYPTTAASDIGGYYKLVSDISDPDYDEPAVDVPTGAISGSDQLLSSLVSAPGLIVGTPGVVNLTIVGNIRKVTGATSTDATFHFHLFKRDALGVETEIGVSDNTRTVSNAIYEEFSASLLFNDGVWLATDRIVLKFYGTKVGGGVDPTYEFQFGGSSPVRALLPVPVNVLLSGYLKTDQTTPQETLGTLKFPNFTAVPTLGVELAPALTGASGVNWSFSTGWTTPLAGSAIHSSNGTGTLLAVTGNIVAGQTYYFEVNVTGLTGTFTITIGGKVWGTISSNGLKTGYVTAINSGRLTITPSNTSRFTITSISNKQLTGNGVATARRFVANGGLTNGFLKANGDVDNTAYMPYLWAQTADANNQILNKLNSARFVDVNGGANGTYIWTCEMPGGYQGLRIYDSKTGDYGLIYLRRKDGTSPSYGDVLMLNSDTGGYNPAPLPAGASLWDVDPDTGAIENKNPNSAVANSVELGYRVKATQEGGVSTGVNTLQSEGDVGRERFSLEGVTTGATYEELYVNAYTYEKISLPPGFYGKVILDIFLVQVDGKMNNWKVSGCLKNSGGVLAPEGSTFVEGGTPGNYWNTDGIGGGDIASPLVNGDSTLYLHLDTDSISGKVLVKIYQSGTPTTGAIITADVEVIRIKQVPAFAYESTYYATSFTDSNANGTYNDALSPYNGKPTFYNGSYTLRFNSMSSVWELVDYMYSVVYTFPTIPPNYDLVGTYIDYMSMPNGSISATAPGLGPYHGVFFGDFMADGYYAPTGNTYNGYTEYSNSNGYYLRWDGMSLWVIMDYMSSYKYTSATIAGQYTDYWTSMPDGYIGDTTTIYTGSGFTNTSANGGYFAQGNTYNGFPVYYNGSCRLRNAGGFWEIIDYMFSQIYYCSLGGPTGQFYDTSTSNPDGTIS